MEERNVKKINVLFGITLIVVMSVALVPSVFAQTPAHMVLAKQMVHQSLYVDSHTMTKHQWARVGSSPYLWDDDTTNYIVTPIPTWNPPYEGFFTFDNTSLAIISSATLYFKAKSTWPPTSSFKVLDANYNLLDEITPLSTSYEWYSFNVSLTDYIQVNNFKVMLAGPALGPQKAQGEQLLTNVIFVTCSYLEVVGLAVSGYAPLGDVYDLEGRVHINAINWEGPGYYWSGFGVKSDDEDTFAEVGIAVSEDGALPVSRILDVYVYFSAVDKGVVKAHPTISLGPSFLGSAHEVWLYLFDNGASLWKGSYQIVNGSGNGMIGQWDFNRHWKGIAQCSIEADDHQPREDANQWIISHWYEMQGWDATVGPFDFTPEWQYTWGEPFYVDSHLGTTGEWWNWVNY
jgi:hypothetical protein